MAKITYTDKSTLNENPSVLAVNKCQADDMNEIKDVVNDTVIEGLGVSTDTYDSTRTYDAGNRVIYDNKFYVCNSNNVTGTWDSTKWDLVPIISNYGLNPNLKRYSGIEHAVGTWIDGSIIYEKTIVYEGTSLPSGVTKINHGILNIGTHKVVVEEEYITNNNSYTHLATTSAFAFTSEINSSQIVIYIGSSWSGIFSKAYITIQYTKAS